VSAITDESLRFYKQSTDQTTLSGKDLFRSVLSVYQGRLRNAKVTVQERMRAEKPVEVFEGETRQVLNNSVGNVIDALLLNGGRLLRRSREATDWRSGTPGLVLTDGDTGSGIPMEMQDESRSRSVGRRDRAAPVWGSWVSKEIWTGTTNSFVRSSRGLGSSGTVFTVFLPYEAAKR
jgi:signal transduction histidine kinase